MKTFSIGLDAWKISTLVLALLLSIALIRPPIIGMIAAPGLSKEEVGRKCLDYINSNLVQPGTTASLVSVEDIGVLYKVLTSYQGREIPVYVTKDGRYMFLQMFELGKPVERPQPGAEFDAPDKEVPEVDLFVMSFCPFGNLAEDAMLNVVDLLKKRAKFRLRYIIDLSTEEIPRALRLETPEGTLYIGSLHGPNEAWADAFEACVQKHHDTLTFWRFVSSVNERCTPIYRDREKLDECLESVSNEHGIDFAEMRGCASSTEVIELLREDESLAREFGITGSPTLIINGARYQGARTPEAFKQAICSGFIKLPAECETELSEEGSVVTGGC